MARLFFNLSILFVLSLPLVSLAAEPPEGMAYIPEGEFIMGNDEADNIEKMGGIVAIDETPKRKVYLKSFYIDKYEATNIQYREFLGLLKKKGFKKFDFYDEEGIPIPYWWKVRAHDKDGEPVAAVDWYMANEYCKLQGKRLPTEEEWEKAARGTD